MDITSFLQLGFLIAFVEAEYFDINDVTDVDTKSSFCGKRLGNILSFYCEEFFVSSSSGHAEHAGIVDFCCSNPCTLRTLMSNYCKKTKKSYEDILSLKQELSNSNGLFQDASDRISMSKKLESSPLQKTKTKPVSKKSGRARCLRRKLRRRNCRNINPSHQNHQNHQNQTNSSHPLNTKNDKGRKKCTCCKEKKKHLPGVDRPKHTPRPANVGFDTSEPQSHIFVNQATYDYYSFPQNL